MSGNTMGRAASRRGLLLVVLAAALWGTSGVATKGIYGLSEASPLMVAALRLALGAPLLWLAYRALSGEHNAHIAGRDLGWMALAGASLGLSQACYFAAIARVGVAIATLVTICTAPVLVSLLSASLLHERITRYTALALAGALLGTTLLVGVGQPAGGSQSNVATGGILLALGAAGCFTAFILTSRVLAPRYHPLLSITVAVSIGALLLLAIAAASNGLTLHYPWQAWTLLLYLGLAPTALGYALFFRGMQHATAAQASVGSLVGPLTSTALALVIFGERLGPLGLVGAGLLIGAVALLYRHS